MSKDDIIGIFGAALSSIFATLGFLWSIGFLQLIFSFLAGSFTTYVVQRRLQMESERRKTKREDAISMRDEVYGPMFKGLSEILEGVRKVTSREPNIDECLQDLKEIMTHYLFFTISQDLKNTLSELINRVDKYQRILTATETTLHNTVRKVTEETYKVDIGFDARAIFLRLQLGEIEVSRITLLQSLLEGIPPMQFVREETKKWGKGTSLHVLIAGNKSHDLSDFEMLYEKVSDKLEGEPLCREEKKQRQALVKELEMFLDQIKDFITVQ